MEAKKLFFGWKRIKIEEDTYIRKMCKEEIVGDRMKTDKLVERDLKPRLEKLYRETLETSFIKAEIITGKANYI